MPKVAMLIKTKTQPGQRDAARDLYIAQLGPRAHANADQELIVWSADQADPDTFYLFEVYSSQEALQANSQQPWFWEYMAQAQPLLAGQPEVSLLSPQWAKGFDV